MLALGVAVLAFLLFGGCAYRGAPAPAYPAPDAAQPDRTRDGGTDGGMM
jgi:hypothetical protein